MNNFPTYDSSIPRHYYDSFGEKEWIRLARDRAGEPLYHGYMDVFRCFVPVNYSLPLRSPFAKLLKLLW